jgi:competence protein ComEC
VDVTIVTGDGKTLDQALPGAGQPNAACQGVAQKETDPSENARSLGFVMKFGQFKVVDLGDLTWNKELELMCPNNKLGQTDLLIVSHHGLDQSNSPALVHALRPKVAIINNGAKIIAGPSGYLAVALRGCGGSGA